MIFGLVTGNDLQMPLDFWPISLRMEAKEYLVQVLKPHVLPWIQANFMDLPETILMQDGAPCQTSKLIQKRLEDHINYWPKYFWPPSSQDLDPMDFSIWANIISMVNDCKHPNTLSLKAAITKAWDDKSANKIQKICSRLRARVEAMVEAKGGYIH